MLTLRKTACLCLSSVVASLASPSLVMAQAPSPREKLAIIQHQRNTPTTPEVIQKQSLSESQLRQEKKRIERSLAEIERNKNTKEGLRKQNEQLQRELAQSKADQGKVLGLKWYWWVLILLIVLLVFV